MRENVSKISIVLPVYNGEKYLPLAIDSVLKQTYTNWEMIIVNDCSTDGTGRIIREYAARDPRIHIHNNSVNLRLPNSLNAGFMRATGDYFTWTSDDNILKPNMLETLISVLEEDSNIGMVYSDFTDIDENGKEIREWKLSDPDGLIQENVCGASFLYRREVAFQVGGYDPDLFLAEDYDYWMRIWGMYPIKHLHKSLYLYRRHDQSLSTTKYNLVIQQTYRAMMKNIQILLPKMKTNKERFDFADHLLNMANEDERIKVDFFLNEMKAYGWHRKKKKLQIKISGCKERIRELWVNHLSRGDKR